jgi:hypothetical protein
MIEIGPNLKDAIAIIMLGLAVMALFRSLKE